MGGLGGASCPQGGDIPYDPWKGGTQGGGGGLDTFPPVPPSTGLGESPQNSEEKIEAEQRKIEEKETEIERELRRTEKEERIERKKRKEEEWKSRKKTESETTDTTETSKETGDKVIEGKRRTTGGDHSFIKRGVQEVPEKGGLGKVKSEKKKMPQSGHTPPSLYFYSAHLSFA